MSRYGGGYAPYMQQQQHLDPQAAAYAQYMQQVMCDVWRVKCDVWRVMCDV